jgi:CBS domain containing-hemolysin-like protein
MATLQKIPEGGDVVEVERKKIHIVEMVGRRISKVKLETVPETAPIDKPREESD